MDCPLLAEMCETDTPVHVLSFFLSEHNGDAQTDLEIMHLQETQHVLTGSGFYTWCGVHVQGPWLPAQSFSVFSSGDGTGNEY